MIKLFLLYDGVSCSLCLLMVNQVLLFYVQFIYLYAFVGRGGGKGSGAEYIRKGRQPDFFRYYK